MYKRQPQGAHGAQGAEDLYLDWWEEEVWLPVKDWWPKCLQCNREATEGHVLADGHIKKFKDLNAERKKHGLDPIPFEPPRYLRCKPR